MKTRRLVLAVLAGILLTAGPRAAEAETKTTVFAAASLTDALNELAAAYQKETGDAAVVSVAASSTLAKQIEQGAPADVFISADADWMDYVATRNLIKPETRLNLLGNTLVLVGPAGAKAVELKAGTDLAALVGTSRLAMGSVASVPVGKYGKAALGKLGIWDAVASKVAEGESVRAALALVARGEAAYGIVYATDAAVEPKVSVVATFPTDSYPAIVYPVAQTKEAGAGATRFAAYLTSAPARAVFEKRGFSWLVK